jgi:hypothetical protein
MTTTDGGQDGTADAADAGDAGPNLCAAPPACGGDLVGTWSVSSACLDVDLTKYTSDCPSSSAHAMDYKIDATLIYLDDLSYRLSGTLKGSVTVTLPATCLTPPNGVQITCAQLEPALLASGNYESVTCAVATSGCICKLVVNTVTLFDVGTYSATARGLFTQTSQTGASEVVHYCVTGDGTMALFPVPLAAKLARQGVTSGSLTLTRQ